MLFRGATAGNLAARRAHARPQRLENMLRQQTMKTVEWFDSPREGESVGARESTISSQRRSQRGVPSIESEAEQPLCMRVVSSTAFIGAINLTIVFSAVAMGVQAEFPSMGDWQRNVLEGVEHVSTGIFMLEMVMKVSVQRFVYFADTWNVLDFIVVWVSITYAWLLPHFVESDSDMSVIKVFRLLRLLRLVKLTNSIPTLRMVVEGLIGSLRALFWIVLLLGMVVYLFAIICVEVVGSKQGPYPGFDKSDEAIVAAPDFQHFNNYEYFGSVRRAMMTLFSMSIGAEWDAFRPVWEFQPTVSLVIIALIFSTTFGIVNVIIGVIVEHTTSSMLELEEQLEFTRKQDHMRTIQSIIDALWKFDDIDGDGEISREEIRMAGENDPEFVQHFHEMGLPKGFTFDDLFDMLNLDGKDGISSKEFKDGMHRMIWGTEFHKTSLMMLGMGQIKQMHRHVMEDQSKLLHREFGNLREDIRRLFMELHESMATVAGGEMGVCLPPPQEIKCSVPEKPEKAMAHQPKRLQDVPAIPAESLEPVMPRKAFASSLWFPPCAVTPRCAGCAGPSADATDELHQSTIVDATDAKRAELAGFARPVPAPTSAFEARPATNKPTFGIPLQAPDRFGIRS